jgi:regulator of replication initiation timing
MTLEELQEALLQEQEKNKTLQSDYDGLKAKNEELVASNARLTEYNNKLFMRVSEPVKDEPKEEDLTADELEAKELKTYVN